MLSILTTLLLATKCNNVSSFLTSNHVPRKSSSLPMVPSLFRGIKGNDSFPRDVKEAVSNCRESVQNALKKRTSRMSIEMPVGAKFGVEKSSKGKEKSIDNSGVSRDVLETSDRELARIFVEMFQPLGGDSISVIFNQSYQANKAKKVWKGQSTAQCRILSIEREKISTSGKKKKRNVGFAAKLNAELSQSDDDGPFSFPSQCELAIFIAPGIKELLTIHRICREVGMDTLVILLNARYDKIENFGSDDAKSLFMNEFEPVFHLGAAPQISAPGCLLYRSYPNSWLLARKPKVGSPKVIATSESKMTEEDSKHAYENMDTSDFEEAFEGVLDNVATWFK